MRDIRELEGLIIKLQSGEITPDGQDRLNDLIRQYPAYQTLLKTHQMLANASRLCAEPNAEEFKHLRNSVLQTVQSRTIRTRQRKWVDWVESIRFYLQRPEIAIAALTLLVGFFLGRALPPESNGARGLMKQINLVATENKALKDVQNSPYRYSNISFEQLDTQNIALSFDVSTHMELVRPQSDPLVREIISQALLNPSPGGSELKVIAMSENMLDKKIKEALIFSLHKAPMLAVRMKSLNALMKYKNDTDIEAAFLEVLKTEESIQMRLMILDYFEEINFDRDILTTNLAGLDKRANSAVLLRAKKYIESKQTNKE
jgi:hypothetical protein